MNEEAFRTTQGFKSYINKPEITALDPRFLVKGSKNVLIDYAQRIVSRNGYTLFGAVGTGTKIVSSFDWDTSTARQFAIRTWGSSMEFYWNNTWNTLKTGLSSASFQFAKVWDNTEKIDVLLGVNGETNMYKWSGGVAKIASATPNTITMQGVLTSKTTIAFVAGTPGTVAATVTDSANGFITAGFASGDSLTVIGSTNNSRTFVIGSVTAGTITLAMSEILVSEIAGTSITLHNGQATFAQNRFLLTGTNKFLYGALEYQYTGGGSTDTLTGVSATVGVSKGTVTMTIASPCVVSFVAHGLVAGDSVIFTTTGALPTGITAGVAYFVIAAGLTADAFEISATVGGAAINTSGGQSGTHTLFKASVPTITIADPMWQTLVTLANSGDINANFKQDLIGVQLNQVVLASTKSQEVYGSLGTNYTNFALTTPRAPGDPFKVNMDNYATCIIPTDNQTQTSSSLLFGGGTSEFFKLNFQLSQDNTSELVRMIKLKTAIGSGLISKSAICSIKNATAYISREPSLDILGYVENVDGASNLPISDPIKNDFDTYDFTNSHAKYFKRAIYITIPSSGILLIYDLMRKLWQPPQTIPISRLAIINDALYGHSSLKNETYKLFDGTDDNGTFIPQVARFAYNNGGNRSRLKNMDHYWTDGYITANGILTMVQNLGFDGSAGKKTMTINGGDTDITVRSSGSSLGDEPLGATPIGGANLDPISGLPSQAGTMLRFYQSDSMDIVDYFESYVEYSMNTLGGQFAIVAHGSNQWDAGTAPITHSK